MKQGAGAREEGGEELEMDEIGKRLADTKLEDDDKLVGWLT